MDAFFLLVTLASGAVWLALRRLRWPWVVYVRDLFIVFAVMFVLRCFFLEWFRIPSSSMEPTLRAGDVVVVDKNDYGITLPFVSGKVTGGRLPERGEIVVFRYPPDPDVFYIKRVVGLPGDRLVYRQDQVLANGEAFRRALVGEEVHTYAQNGSSRTLQVLWEEIAGGGWHRILLNPGSWPRGHYRIADREDGCAMADSEVHGPELVCDIPEGRVLVLGDNRHHSSDSRDWGFVPVENLVGPAFGVIFSLPEVSRIGTGLAPREAPPDGARLGDDGAAD